MVTGWSSSSGHLVVIEWSLGGQGDIRAMWEAAWVGGGGGGRE